jgi:hypothetical protein
VTLPQSHEAVVALVEVLNGAWTAPEAQPERQSGRLQHGAGPQTDQSSLQKTFRLRLRSVSLGSLGSLFRHSSSKACATGIGQLK